MPNTTNFNWPTPADTDLVKDGAAAIRNLGDGVDTSLVDLKGGTTGQILSKASDTDMDFAFITPNVGDLTEVQAGVGISIASGTGPVPVITNSSTELIPTAGDLLYGTAADTVARLGIGTAGQVLQVNSGATAPEWATPAAGGVDWVAWTPTYGNLTIGNGTVTSVKAQDGEMGYFFWRLVICSTTSVGSGPYIDLPYTNLYNNTTFYGSIRDASAGVFYTLIGLTGTADDNLYLATEKSDGTYVTIADVTSAIPVTFATGDILVITGAYPV